MREIRHFELAHGEPATGWDVTRPLILNVTAGKLWLTIEGDSEDYWLAAGDSFELPRAARAWVSAERGGARFALAFVSLHADDTRPAVRTAGSRWLPRWLMAA
jgi:quercetin dioxygenase-like cupin family protein